MIRLTIQGPEGARTLRFSGAEMLLGSRDGADLRLRGEGVAPSHCLLRAADGGFQVVDLGGGTTVNGARVREANVVAGDEIRIGPHRIRMEPPAVALEPLPPARAAAPPPPPESPPLRPRASEFEREIRELVAKAPWWSTAFVIHLAILYLLTLLEAPRTPEREARAFHTGPDAARADSVDPLPDIERSLPPAPDEPTLDPVEDLVETDPLARPDPTESPDAPELTRKSDKNWFTPILKTKLVPQSPDPAIGTGGDAPGGEAAHQAARRQAEILVSRRLGGEMGRLRGALRRDSLVVVKGDYDSIEDVLSAHSLPHVVITKDELLTRSLRRDQVLFINCGLKPNSAEYERYGEKIRGFVDSGGWVMTSDWAIDPYLSRAFPKAKIQMRSDRNPRDETIRVALAKGEEENPLVQGILGLNEEVTWWLENSSDKFQLDKDSTARALLVQTDALEKSGPPVIAFVVAGDHQNGGRAVHLLGHFHQKSSHPDGIAGMQHLVINYLGMKFGGG